MNTFPELSQLTIPESVKTSLIAHLLEPFQTLSEAKAYWEASGTRLVIGEVPEDPEYTEPLLDGYSISLVITSDAGEGVYYVTKPGANK